MHRDTPLPGARRLALRAGAAASVALGLALAGCSSAGPATSSVAADCTPAHDDLTTFTEGTLTVGVPENLPYSGTSGTDATGADVDLLKLVAETECLEIAYVPITYANGIAMITEQHKADVITGGWYVTEDRAKQVGFTSPTQYDAMAIVSADGISTVDELLEVGDVGSGAGFSWEADSSALLGDSYKSYPGTVEMKQDLVNGRIQASLDGYAVALIAYEGTDFEVEAVEPDSRIAVTEDPPIISYPIDPDNQALSDAVSELIDGWREDGTLADVLGEYDLADLIVPADVAATSLR
ncbi:transporter substrate-binding domain-containing protein [Microbacterium marinilacus]|uniref:Solute-binding protein family 3/N-terminal domain-containing protein n=1 Tax=Microbacterium marinilacus TaxID=415209 RepID=A0ABP7B7D4_9MICO|nr:transporter substrate-binding domain-containing protein [Microbacterium marinilacus]MBY0689969.1 transporter substrate-binding domain-containing protein [Microbacterium marinilacus]